MRSAPEHEEDGGEDLAHPYPREEEDELFDVSTRAGTRVTHGSAPTESSR